MENENQKNFYKKVQLITVNELGKIVYSDANLFKWEKGDIIYDAHPFFSIIEGLREAVTSEENEFTFPCVHLNETKDSERICDVTFTVSFGETNIVIFDYTHAYLELNKISQERNESLIKAQELEFTNRLLVEKENFKNDFIASINHELTTPLTSIKGFLELLQKTKLDYEQEELVRIIRTESDHLQNIFGDMFDISRIESGGFRLEEEPFDLVELFNTIVNSNRAPIENQALDFISEIDSKLNKDLIGDKTRLYQIISNLLSNSLKYTDEGFVKFSIKRIGGKNKKQQIAIIIEDSGIGISEEDKLAVFEPFSQLDPNIKGSGLGLNIVRSLVSLMGGEIELDSIVGKGSKFTINLSLRNATGEDAEEEKNNYVLPTDQKFRILVVENQLNTQYLILKILLAQGNFFVDAVSSGEAAIKAIENRNYNLIITDIKLEEISGFQLAQRVRNQYGDEAIKNLPILGISALRAPNMTNRAISAGMDSFLAKPFSEKQLLQKVSRLLFLALKK